MKSCLLLFSSPPGSQRSVRGLKLASELVEKGENVIIFAMQDAVLLAVKQLLFETAAVLGKVAEAFALNEHLVKRGFTSENLRPPFKAVGYDGLVDLITRDEVLVVGSF